jgi:hypothetical protein
MTNTRISASATVSRPIVCVDPGLGGRCRQREDQQREARGHHDRAERIEVARLGGLAHARVEQPRRQQRRHDADRDVDRETHSQAAYSVSTPPRRRSRHGTPHPQRLGCARHLPEDGREIVADRRDRDVHDRRVEHDHEPRAREQRQRDQPAVLGLLGAGHRCSRVNGAGRRSRASIFPGGTIQRRRSAKMPVVHDLGTLTLAIDRLRER